MAVINTNVKALFSQNALTVSGRSQALAMQQLSTGKRINSARDDAAGMAIATRMTQQIRSLNQAVRNAGDAINLIQTAEGATNEITDMMQRMRELAVQAVNDTNDNSQRSYLDLEFQQLKQQIVQISDNTEWNGFPVLNGTAGERVGEMPVYKVTSENQFGSVFINPTTTRTVAGPDAGEQQTLRITGTPPSTTETAQITFPAGGLTAGQSLTLGGLTYTATTAVSQTNVAAAFANINAGTTAASLTTAAKGTGTGTWSGTLTDYSTGVAVSGGVTFTSTTPGQPVTDLSVNVGPTPSLPTAVRTTGVAGTTTESSEISFKALSVGQFFTVGGLKFTASVNMSKEDVAAAFANLDNGAQSGSEIAKGTYSGTLTGFSSGVTDAEKVTFTSSLPLTVTPAITFDGGPVAPTATALKITRTVVGSATPTTEASAVTFPVLKSGESITVAGLTFTASKDLLSTEVASAFTSLAASAQTGTGTPTLGSYSGTLDATYGSGTATGSTVTFTDPVGGRVTTALPTPTTTSTNKIIVNDGTVSTPETANVTFIGLTAGQSVTVGGLTYTANQTCTADQVAAAFSGLPNPVVLATQQAVAGVGTRGTYSGSLSLYTTPAGSTNPVVFTGAANGAVADLTVTYAIPSSPTITPVVTPGTGLTYPLTINVAGVDIVLDSPTAASTDSIATRIQQTLSNDPKFSSSSGRSVSVSGSVITINYAPSDGNVVPTTFDPKAGLGLTATVGTTRQAITTGSESFKGNGSFLSSGALSMSVDRANVVTASFTTVTGETIPMQGILNANAVTESSAITFNDITAGQSVTLGGLTFTAKAAVSAVNVAAAFASLANGATTGPGVSNGDYSGILSGFASGAANSSAVTFSSISTGTNVTNLPVSGSGALPVVFVTDGAPTSSITFIKDTGTNSKVISDDLVYTFKNFDATSSAVNNRGFSFNVSVEGSIPALRAGDLKINGIDIGASHAIDDKLSPKGNAAGSAIAKAAAINRMAVAASVSQGEKQMLTFTGNPGPGTITVGGVSVMLNALDTTSAAAASKIASALQASPLFAPNTGRVVNYIPGNSNISITYAPSEGNLPDTAIQTGATGLTGLVDTVAENFISQAGTGVFAKVNENIMTGKAMSGNSVVKGTVFINGYASADITTALNNSRKTREDVVRAINLISDKTGVKAIDTGSDAKGITLSAADGRNIEVSFETTANGDDFASRIGLRAGVQSSTISLESKIPAPVILSSDSTGDIARAGLINGNFSKNEAVTNTSPRSIVGPNQAQIESVVYSGTSPLNGDTFSITLNGKTFTYTAGTNSDALTVQAVRDGLVAKVNLDTILPITATAGRNKGEILLTSDSAGTSFTVKNSQSNSTTTTTASTVKPNLKADYKPLGMDDLIINGVKIPASTRAGDPDSNTIATSSDPSSSAIAIAKAINSQTPLTGVLAKANGAEIAGVKTDTSLPILTTPTFESLFVNGTEIKVQFVQNEPETERLNKVVEAINTRTGQHGVTAVNNGNGISLKSDGRNLSVWFDSDIKDLSAANFGLDQGGAVAQTSQINFSGPYAATDKASITINGVTVTSAANAAATPLGFATVLKAAIDAAVTSGAIKNISVSNNNGILSVSSTVAGSPFEISGAAMSGTLVASSMAINEVVPNGYGNNQVTGIRNATATSTTARTVYGTVRMIAMPPSLPGLPKPAGAPPSEMDKLLMANAKPFTIATGADGFGENSNFSTLGFNEGSFGGRSSSDMDPPKVGRLAFQVGSSANQTVTIDLADFGSNGPITGEITGDVDLNVDQRTVRINTREGASDVLTKLDSAMDKVNATRATMGAVMNRLDHVINNLTNVSMNLSTSRSGIEDADYAASSTELAKTQIMQQAATAVLAQANTSQQTVLKLLGG